MRQWVRLNYLRLSIVFVAWVAALQSFALVHERIGGAT